MQIGDYTPKPYPDAFSAAQNFRIAEATVERNFDILQNANSLNDPTTTELGRQNTVSAASTDYAKSLEDLADQRDRLKQFPDPDSNQAFMNQILVEAGEISRLTALPLEEEFQLSSTILDVFRKVHSANE